MTANVENRLRWHAGLVDQDALPGVMPIAACLASPAASRDDVEVAMTDLLAAMSRLNFELNSSTPSQSGTAETAIPRATAYAVAEIARMLRDAGEREAPFVPDWSSAAWRVETAWLAVLAGDVDDLEAHIREEERMRLP